MPGGPIVVVGLGNVLLGDDGAGVLALRELQKDVPEGVVTADVGTAILHAEYLLEQADRILALDAFQSGGEPGATYVTTLQGLADDHGGDSPHGITFASLLHSRGKPLPDTVIIGVEPATLEFGAAVSEPVTAAIPAMVATARKVLSFWLKEPERRADEALESILGGE